MSAPVLTIAEQKASISGKKKKKKTMKNVLNIPINLKVQSPSIDTNEARKLISILERSLPSARLPLEQSVRSKKNLSQQTSTDTQLREEAHKKRNQLSLGVNALNRSIKRELISAVLFADDIQPAFLIHHLMLLCNHSNIPFLKLPGLREVTKNYLGFPSIAVGFKKDFCDFSEVVEEVISIFQTKSVVSDEKDQEDTVKCGEPDKVLTANKTLKDSALSDENSFKYLYRTSTKERIFIPNNNDQSKFKSKAEFIAVKGSDNDNKTKEKNNVTCLGISSKFLKNQRNQIKSLKVTHNDNDEDDDDDDDDDEEEDLKVPKKKIKKDWVIDTVGTKQKINCYPANVKRFSSNPDRNNRRNK